MADLFFTSFKKKMADGTIDLDSHSFKACLLTDVYVPSAAHGTYAQLTGEVANGNG